MATPEYDPYEEAKRRGFKLTPASDYDPFAEAQKRGFKLTRIGEPAQPGYLRTAAAGFFEPISDIPGAVATVGEKLGHPLPSWRRAERLLSNIAVPEEERAGLDIPHRIAYGVGQAPLTAAEYMIPGGGIARGARAIGVAPKVARALGNILGFGGVEAARALPQGPEEMLKRGAMGAAMGGIMERIAPFRTLPRMGAMGATFGGQAAIEALRQGLPPGQALKEGIAPAVIGAGMGLLGGRPPERPPGPPGLPAGPGLAREAMPTEIGIPPEEPAQGTVFESGKAPRPAQEAPPAVPLAPAVEPPPPPDVGTEPNVSPIRQDRPLVYDLTKLRLIKARAGDVKTDVKNLQFKQDVNAEGVQKPLEGEWNEAAAGMVLLWQKKDDTLWMANGHQRLNHAKKINPDILLNAQVLREADGYSMEDARRIAAEANILDGKGTIYDHAEYFRLTPYTEEIARRAGLKGKGYAIGKFATPNTYALFRDRKIIPEVAEAISSAAPNDESLQAAALKYLRQNPKLDPLQLEMYAEGLKNAPEMPTMQEGLFKWDRASEEQAARQADFVFKVIGELRENINAIRGAAKRPEIAGRFGINVEDPEAIQNKVREFNNEIARWKKWPKWPDLKEKVYAVTKPFEKEPPRVPAPAAKEITFKTSEQAQRAIDDFENKLVKKYGEKELFNIPIWPEEYHKIGVEPPPTKLNPEELSSLRSLYEAREKIDKQDLDRWRNTISKETGLSEEETNSILESLGMRRGGPAEISFASDTLRNWGRDVTANLEKLYNHLTQGKPDRTMARFRWGGTADKITLEGSVFDEDVRPSKWDKDALAKTEKIYNAIAKTQSEAEINLSKIGKNEPAEQKPELILRSQGPFLNAREAKVLGLSQQEVTRLNRLQREDPEQYKKIMSSYAEELKRRKDLELKGRGEAMTQQDMLAPKGPQRPLLSKRPGGEGLLVERIDSIVQGELGGLKDSPKVVVVDSLDDLPSDVRSAADQGTEAIYSRNKKTVYVLRGMIPDEGRFRDVLRHEVTGHYGMEAMLGEGANKFYDRVYLRFGRAGLEDIAKAWGLNLDTLEGRRGVARERVAMMAENNENPGLMKQFYNFIRDTIYKLSGGRWAKELTEDQIRAAISKANENLRREIPEPTMNIDRKPYTMEDIAKEFGPPPAEQSRIRDLADEFHRQDIVPKALQFKEGIGRTLKWIANFAVPRHGVPRENLDLIMDRKGYMERKISEFLVNKVYRQMNTEFDRMPQPELIRFIDNIKTGTPQATPRLQQMDQAIRELDRTIGEQYRRYKPDMSWIKDHFRVLWKVVPGTTEEQFASWMSRRSLEGPKGFFKMHTLANLSEGLERGGIPFSYNPMELMEMHYRDALKYISTQEMWAGLKDIGARVFVRRGERAPEGFARLNDRIARVFFPAHERPVDLEMGFPERTVTAERAGRRFGFVQSGEWYVEENAARILNNYLSRDYFRESPLGQGLMFWKNISTMFELGFSPFHFAFETLEAMSSQIGLGMRKVWNQGMVREGLKDIITAPAAARELYMVGKSAMRYFENPQEFIRSVGGQEFIQKYPGAAEMIDDLFAAGGKLGMHEDYRINILNTLRQNLENKNYIGAALRSVPGLMQYMVTPMFEKYIPKLKWGLFFREFGNELTARQADLDAGLTSRHELARKVWDFVENRLGEMNFDNIFWDRTFKSSLQMLVRSVTWKLGNIRAYGQAVTGQSAEILNAFREGRRPMLSQEMAWAWGLFATTAALASVTQYAFTGKNPEDWKDLTYPKINEQGDRISLPTYIRDLFSGVHAPFKYVGSSLSGWIGRMIEVLNNKDFYGVRVHDPEENVLMQRFDDLVHMVPLPFSFTTWQRMREQGMGGIREALGFMGATKAPYWIEKTEAQQLATELAAQKLPMGGRSKAEFERYKLLKQRSKEYLDAQREGKPTQPVEQAIQEDVRSGKLRIQDVAKFRARTRREPLEQTVSHLTLSESMRIWDKASTEEKKRIGPLIFRHYRSSKSPEERMQFRPKMEEIRKELPP